MIISIDEELFNKVLQIVKSRNSNIYDELTKIKPLQDSQIDSLQKARDIKTDRIKQSIKNALQALQAQNITPTKYKVHKETKIAYTTINKYYNDILKELP
ncbi:MAG: hypothetical protein QG567_2088 [Campylobacterota bacterium]|nr:hypothetical protein [Campylobacterota bacterium]